ncbi:hypothetical protein CYMTET_25534 [Cymbomonas tetramitiformis]|uniref:Ion transport domain-containing protein n=1 Tax=Cymbomonas tetramitiformis TaxID=36881 RepID=A0AAE0FU11_9CHLO|nr:hypothetical protein CYMTET_25534 [Cymbomonas tetramitiformis]
MFAHWPTMFWESGWNWFDFLVVSISLMSLLLEGLPGISTLRLMRAFRVFRLFKRLASLRKIIKALENAIPGCSNAFSIVILVNAIYSILGVEFFSEAEPGFFGTFASAMLTMFQVMTGDSWAQSIARPIIDVYPVASIFFVSYILVANIMLVNVVIAVLLEKMVDGGDDEDESDEPPPLPDCFLVDPDTDDEEEQEVTSDSEKRKSAYRASAEFASQGTQNGNQDSHDQVKSSQSKKSLSSDKHGDVKGPAPPVPACGFHLLNCIVDRLETLQSELNEMKAELSSIELNNSQPT